MNSNSSTARSSSTSARRWRRSSTGRPTRSTHPEDLPRAVELFSQSIASGAPFDFEVRARRFDGVYRWLQTRGFPLRDADGRIVRWYNLLIDIDERKRAEEALSKARSELAHVARVTSLGALTASIAHEVNQPLSGIITNASTCLRMLAADPPNIDGAQETARRTIRDGNRAADVIARLRALFSKRTAAIEPVDLNEAVREVIALSWGDLQRSRVVLRTELADGLPPVGGDRVQLQQVIMNLLRNAADAMSGIDDRPRRAGDQDRTPTRTVRSASPWRTPASVSGPTVRSGSSKLSTRPRVTAWESGCPSAAPSSRAISGRLWAASNDGPGATFSFSIPEYSGEETPCPRGRRHAGAGHQQCPECSGDFMKVTHPLVSVVDDDESVRESLPDLLKEFGFSVEAFSSAEEFLASDSVRKTRCLILDVAMPGMTGPDLQRELARRGQSIPIVFITAHKDDTVRPRLLEQGAVECLFKPFSDAALQEALSSALEWTDRRPCYGHPRGDNCHVHGLGDCTWRRSEVGIHAARNTCRVRRRRRCFRARIAGAAHPLRGLAAGDVRVRAGIPRSPAGAWFRTA